MTATPETAPLDATPVNLEAPAPRGTLSQDRQSLTERVLLFLFIAIPLLAVVAAIPLAWGWGVGWLDLALLAVYYAIAAGGITVGFHRHFTHGVVQGQPAAADRPGRRRVVRHRGPADPLGRRPPQAPRVQRPRGRPALPVAVRRPPPGR